MIWLHINLYFSPAFYTFEVTKVIGLCLIAGNRYLQSDGLEEVDVLHEVVDWLLRDGFRGGILKERDGETKI